MVDLIKSTKRRRGFSGVYKINYKEFGGVDNENTIDMEEIKFPEISLTL
jgi:hypothetical protein